MLNELENSCLRKFKDSTLQQILENPGDKNIPRLMIKLTNEILETSSNKRVSKKVISRLARTMALTTTCGAKHNDIDQPIPPSEARRLRGLAKTICRCKTDKPKGKKESNTSHLSILL